MHPSKKKVRILKGGHVDLIANLGWLYGPCGLAGLEGHGPIELGWLGYRSDRRIGFRAEMVALQTRLCCRHGADTVQTLVTS
jgi:hypothetical protein